MLQVYINPQLHFFGNFSSDEWGVTAQQNFSTGVGEVKKVSNKNREEGICTRPLKQRISKHQSSVRRKQQNYAVALLQILGD